nr:cytochrome P450 71A9-like [Arachis hypogaea]
MFLKLGSFPTLVVSLAEIAKEIFKNHDMAFSGCPKLYAANRLGYNGSAMTFTPYGDYWKEIRKIVMLELLSAKRVQSFQAVRFEEVQVLLHSIALFCGSPVNLSHLKLSLTSNIVCRIAFGQRLKRRSLKGRRVNGDEEEENEFDDQETISEEEDGLEHCFNY